jgi:hypothetical protein
VFVATASSIRAVQNVRGDNTLERTAQVVAGTAVDRCAGDLLPVAGMYGGGKWRAFIRATRSFPSRRPAHRIEEVSDNAYAAGLVVLTRVGPFGDVAGLSKKARLELPPRARSIMA